MNVNRLIDGLSTQIKKEMTKRDAKGVTSPQWDYNVAMELKLTTWVACQLPLPESPVDNLSQYYATHVRGTAMTLTQQLNEETVLSVSRFTKEVYRQWKLRYKLIHEPFCGESLQVMQRTLEMANHSDLDPGYKPLMDNYAFLSMPVYYPEG